MKCTFTFLARWAILAILWALTDNLGTVRDLVNNSGVVQNQIKYDSFGNVTSQTNTSIKTRFGYTGREFDAETGLYYYRARYYDAAVGRFISEDPISFAGGDVNLYRYVGNSPVDSIDPYGLIAPILLYGAAFIAGFLTGYLVVPPSEDFYRNYKSMRDANWIGADKYFHCKANCEAAQKGTIGALVAAIISESRELFDERIKGNSPEVCQEDRQANNFGREEGSKNKRLSCQDICQKFRPKGMPQKYG